MKLAEAILRSFAILPPAVPVPEPPPAVSHQARIEALRARVCEAFDRLKFYKAEWGLPEEKALAYWRDGIDIDAALELAKRRREAGQS